MKSKNYSPRSELRELAIEKLLAGINDTHAQALALTPDIAKQKRADYKLHSWQKQNYFRVMGYLVQVLNSVLTKEDVDMLKLQVADARRRILELERSREAALLSGPERSRPAALLSGQGGSSGKKQSPSIQ